MSDGVALLRAERLAFRRGVLQVAGGILALLGPLFALSEWSAQSTAQNIMLLTLLPVGVSTLALARAGWQRSAVATLTLGVLPVLTWVHLFGNRADMAVMYLVPVLVMGMVASDRFTARTLPVALVAAAAALRATRWGLAIETDWGVWLTESFDALAVITITGVLMELALRRMARNESILRDALADRARHAEVARTASDDKSAFLARVSHELRTPLNAILGYTELLLEEEALEPAHAEDLARVHKSGSHLLVLVDAVLDLSNVEAGRTKVDLQQVDLVEIVRTLRATALLLVARNHNSLVVEDCGSIRVRLDAPKVVQVLLNLLSNAARYTRDGTVTLRVCCEPSVVVFEVVDTGVGMTPAQLAVLFQPFLQGKGLGLALCDRFVRHMGGHIEVTSEPDVGSTFRVVLPAG